jgi:phosphatidate cytidylyltransferase
MLKRWITGIGLFSLGLLLISVGGFWFWLWIFMVALFCMFELLQISVRPLPFWMLVSGLVSIAVAMSVALLPGLQELWKSPVAMGIAMLMMGMALAELVFRRLWFQHHPFLSFLRSLIFICFTCPYIYLVRTLPHGGFAMFFCLLAVTSSDSFALFGGRAFGKTPLSDLSPNKTVEGSVIGFFGSLGVSALYIWFFGLPFWVYFLTAIGIGFLAQLGDLHESLTKRFYHVKDSSAFLPGHGGFYDRADSYLLVSSFVYYAFLIFLG